MNPALGNGSLQIFLFAKFEIGLLLSKLLMHLFSPLNLVAAASLFFPVCLFVCVCVCVYMCVYACVCAVDCHLNLTIGILHLY